MTDRTVELRTIEDARVVVLAERSTSSEVWIVADVGANVARFRTRVGDTEREILAAPPDIATLRARPTRFGSACLFPYPGRVAGGAFSFGGRTYQLPTDARDGHAIHGVVRTRPWEIVALTADDRGASATLHIDTRSAAIPISEWPWPFDLRLVVTLVGGVLRVATTVRNIGGEAMPFGLGFHPYFPTPFGPAGSQDACAVWVDADEQWRQSGGLPTGEIVPLGPSGWPRVATPLGQIVPDVVSAEGPVRNALYRRLAEGPASGPGGMRAGIVDSVNGVAVSVRASVGFDRTVFFTPPSPAVVSIEPQTCVPNALALAATSALPTGLEVLQPGERWNGWFEIMPEALPN